MAWKNIIEFRGCLKLNTEQMNEIEEMGYRFDAQEWLTREGYIRDVIISDFSPILHQNLSFFGAVELSQEQADELNKQGRSYIEDILFSETYVRNFTVEECLLIERFEQAKPSEQQADDREYGKQQTSSDNLLPRPSRRIVVRASEMKQKSSAERSCSSSAEAESTGKVDTVSKGDEDCFLTSWTDIPSDGYYDPLLGAEIYGNTEEHWTHATLPWFDKEDSAILEDLAQRSGYWEKAYSFINEIEEIDYELSDKQKEWLWNIRADLDAERHRRDRR